MSTKSQLSAMLILLSEVSKWDNKHDEAKTKEVRLATRRVSDVFRLAYLDLSQRIYGMEG